MVWRSAREGSGARSGPHMGQTPASEGMSNPHLLQSWMTVPNASPLPGWLPSAVTNDSATLGGRVRAIADLLQLGAAAGHHGLPVRLDGGGVEPLYLPGGGHLGLQRPRAGTVPEGPVVVGLEHPADGHGVDRSDVVPEPAAEG